MEEYKTRKIFASFFFSVVKFACKDEGICVNILYENVILRRSGMLSKLLNIGMLLSGSGTTDRIVATAEKVNEVLKSIVAPCLSVLEGCAVIYIVILAVQYVKSENADKRTEAKKRIVNLAIGAVIILVMLTMCYLIKWDKLVPELFGYLGSGQASGGGGGGNAGGGADSKPTNNRYDALNAIRALLFR